MGIKIREGFVIIADTAPANGGIAQDKTGLITQGGIETTGPELEL